MRNRWIYFGIAVVVGAMAGVIIGWVFLPAEYIDTSPDVLRVDFKADYVLMVAEYFAREGDLAKALAYLAFLGETPPDKKVQQALFFAEPRYADADLALLRGLLKALEAENLSEGGGQ
jgi:hypothetical protein